MSKHFSNIVLCRKRSGVALGRVCDRCDGKCVHCDSEIGLESLVRICDECSFLVDGNGQQKCLVCDVPGAYNLAYYCYQCCLMGYDCLGCPRVTSMGSARIDSLYFEKKKTLDIQKK
mmetsp:Transcript_34323/g.53590  ORF Transcript_34323/g.53590 Transcript_34323/m.53590 type:complete len:117 (+) Transcript_34323:40-390(+)